MLIATMLGVVYISYTLTRNINLLKAINTVAFITNAYKTDKLII